MAAAFAFAAPRADKTHLRRVTGWVEDSIPDGMDEVTVMVNEMQCFEPDCAPLETVITLLGAAGGKTIIFKIFKPAELVTPDEATAGLESALSGQQMAQHMPQVSASS